MSTPKTGPELGAERKLIFENVANGVPMETVMATFLRSEAEVLAECKFVGKKIMEYRIRRGIPALPYETLADIRWHRKAMLQTLGNLGPIYLSSPLLFTKISVERVTSPGQLRDAARATRMM